jgi:hypothetical protein
LRDDSVTNKTFFVFPNRNNDSLLFDYNLAVGDTMKEHSVYTNSNLVVSSVDSILINGQYRKRWNFHKGLNNDSTYFIEGVGSSGGLIEPLNTYAIDFTYRHLVCVKDSAATLFVSNCNSAQGCQLIVEGINEKEFGNNFQISPNPNNGFFTLSSSANITSMEI